MHDDLNRRTFIKAAMTGGITLGLGSPLQGFSILKSYPVKDKFNVAIMGVNGRGMALAKGFAMQEKARVSYICDVDEQAMMKGVESIVATGQPKPKGMLDFRDALERRSVDILCIAAPDHWHTPAAILGLKAGKHIYVEKPGSHNPAETELLKHAQERYAKVVQLGNQRRSWPRVREAIQSLHNGVIGKVYFAKAWYTNTRPTIGLGKNTPVPSWLDYDLWQGPAPRKPFKDNIIHYNWHWHWHWGTGEIVNNGTHFIDLARWGLNVGYPVKVYSTGGRYQYQDDWETPDTQIATFDFEGGKTILWEGRSCNQRGINDMGSGVSFHGEEGTLELHNNAYRIYNNEGDLVTNAASTTNTTVAQTGPGFDLDKDHLANFLESVESGKTPHSDYTACYKSVLLGHLANISYRVGRTLYCDGQHGHIKNDAEAMKLWNREYESGWQPVL